MSTECRSLEWLDSLLSETVRWGYSVRTKGGLFFKENTILAVVASEAVMA